MDYIPQLRPHLIQLLVLESQIVENWHKVTEKLITWILQHCFVVERLIINSCGIWKNG